MKTCLQHFKRCPYPSSQFADISLVGDHYQFWPPGGHSDLLCHPGSGIVKGGTCVVLPSASGRHVFPSRKLSNWGSREGGHTRSPVSGWDQSNGDGSTLSASSGQDGRGASSDGDWGTPFTWVSSTELDSSRATLLLGWVGLGDGIHPLAGSPGWPTTEWVCSSWLVGRHLLQLLVHLLLCESYQLPDRPQLPDHPWGTGWPILLMWPSNRVADTSAWEWVSLVTLSSSLHDSCCLSWKWPKWS